MPWKSIACPREAVQEGVYRRVDPVTDLGVARFITQHGAVDQIEGDHIVEEGGRLMRIGPPQSPCSLLFLDEPGNDAPRYPRTALEPGAPERRKARRFGDDKPLKRQMPILKQDGEERQSERSQSFHHAEGGHVDRNERRKEIFAQPFHDGDEKSLFVAEVVVDIGFRAADDANDFVDADAVIAMLKEQLGRRRADLFGLLVAASSATDGSSRRVGKRCVGHVLMPLVGDISGCHINPAVTVGLAVAGEFPRRHVVPYIIAQVAGAVAAAAVLLAVFGGPVNHLGATLVDTHRITYGDAFALEAIGTFFLVNTVLHTAVRGAAGRLAPFAIGMTVTVCILMFGALTGGSVNPARTIGPAVATGMFNGLAARLRASSIARSGRRNPLPHRSRPIPCRLNRTRGPLAAGNVGRADRCKPEPTWATRPISSQTINCRGALS